MKIILNEEIETYIGGQLSSAEEELFEMKMENDPFLHDAVDGYKMFPESLPSKTVLKANLVAVLAIALVGLMWVGLWRLERSLLINMEHEPAVSVEKAENPRKQIVEMSPLQKKDVAFIQNSIPDEIPTMQKSIPILLKAIPREASEITGIASSNLRRPLYRYQAVFIHNLKVFTVDTTSRSEQDVLPEHLPARWESESQLEGSRKIFTPMASHKHYMDYPLELFQKGQFKNCLLQLDRVSERLPKNLNINFYRALCFYHLEEYKSALKYFRITQGNIHQGFTEEAEWYEALCLEKTGSLHQAKNAYSEIVNQGGFYSMRAASRLAVLLQPE